MRRRSRCAREALLLSRTRPGLAGAPPAAGKGSSEFFYSWIPFVAPFAGGAAAGGLYLAMQQMNHSALP